jgi:hypothetical protein
MHYYLSFRQQDVLQLSASMDNIYWTQILQPICDVNTIWNVQVIVAAYTAYNPNNILIVYATVYDYLIPHLSYFAPL